MQEGQAALAAQPQAAPVRAVGHHSCSGEAQQQVCRSLLNVNTAGTRERRQAQAQCFVTAVCFSVCTAQQSPCECMHHNQAHTAAPTRVLQRVHRPAVVFVVNHHARIVKHSTLHSPRKQHDD